MIAQLRTTMVVVLKRVDKFSKKYHLLNKIPAQPDAGILRKKTE